MLELIVESESSPLSVREFVVDEEMSGFFRISVLARSPAEDLDLDAMLGEPVAFRITATPRQAFLPRARAFRGICSAVQLVQVEEEGLSTYALTIVPRLWLLTQRVNHRIFQHIAIPDIVDRLLEEHGVSRSWHIDRASYPALELRVQYGETDYAFFCRLLEEAGIAFCFEQGEDERSVLILRDRPQAAGLRSGPPLPYLDKGQAQNADVVGQEFVTLVQLTHEVRPGRQTIRDFDFRRPNFPLTAEALADRAQERSLEQYHYLQGSFLVETGAGTGNSGRVSAGRVMQTIGDVLDAAGVGGGVESVLQQPGLGAQAEGGGTPVADNRSVARFEQAAGTGLAQRGLDGRRISRRVITFETSALDLGPGVVFAMDRHQRSDLASSRHLLVVGGRMSGTVTSEWRHTCRAVFAEQPYRPAMTTPKPRIFGLQSAIVVGPEGEEIYTDEFGRVRVLFHWDREHGRGEDSSIWMRVSQGWAGPGYGMQVIPRVGHEVLVGFLDGDPDCPVVVGRAFNGVNQVPYKLPEHKTVSTWKSDSTPGSGGFNEIRFDDAKGREYLYVQAEKNKGELVKNDAMHVVGHDRTAVVRNDEALTVGRDRTKVVQHHEVETTGLNKTTTVGLNRNATIGGNDSTLVGSRFSVTMARGLAARLPKELGRLMDGPLGPVLRGPLTALLGIIPQSPLGSAQLTEILAHGPMALLERIAPAAFRSVLGVLGGFTHDPGPAPTSFEMVDRKITFTTGEASITLEGPNITLMADGNILLHAKKSAGVLADEDVAVVGEDEVLVCSKKKDVIVQGDQFVHLNPYPSSSEVTAEGSEGEPSESEDVA